MLRGAELARMIPERCTAMVRRAGAEQRPAQPSEEGLSGGIVVPKRAADPPVVFDLREGARTLLNIPTKFSRIVQEPIAHCTYVAYIPSMSNAPDTGEATMTETTNPIDSPLSAIEQAEIAASNADTTDSHLSWGARRALTVELDRLYETLWWAVTEEQRDRAEEIEHILAANPIDGYTSEEIDADKREPKTTTTFHIRKPLARSRSTYTYIDRSDRGRGTLCGAPETEYDALSQDRAVDWKYDVGRRFTVCPACLSNRNQEGS